LAARERVISLNVDTHSGQHITAGAARKHAVLPCGTRGNMSPWVSRPQSAECRPAAKVSCWFLWV